MLNSLGLKKNLNVWKFWIECTLVSLKSKKVNLVPNKINGKRVKNLGLSDYNNITKQNNKF